MTDVYMVYSILLTLTTEESYPFTRVRRNRIISPHDLIDKEQLSVNFSLWCIISKTSDADASMLVDETADVCVLMCDFLINL